MTNAVYQKYRQIAEKAKQSSDILTTGALDYIYAEFPGITTLDK